MVFGKHRSVVTGEADLLAWWPLSVFSTSRCEHCARGPQLSTCVCTSPAGPCLAFHGSAEQRATWSVNALARPLACI